MKITNEMQTNSEGATANLKNIRVGLKMAGLSKELKNISPTRPRLTIVTVVLFSKELTRAWEGCVVYRLRSFIVRYTLVSERIIKF